jgi:predicted membrane protein
MPQGAYMGESYEGIPRLAQYGFLEIPLDVVLAWVFAAVQVAGKRIVSARTKGAAHFSAKLAADQHFHREIHMLRNAPRAAAITRPVKRVLFMVGFSYAALVVVGAEREVVGDRDLND